MPGRRRVLRVGLTGGIASGKTTVAGFLRQLGALVVDADRAAHAATSPGGPAYDDVLARFGPEILDDAGRIDRRRLGAIVFADEEARLALNALVHPHVRAEAARRADEREAEGGVPIAVFDAALLVETGAARDMHRLVVTSCPPGTQLERLLARGLDPEQARRRLAAQAPLEAKLAAAHYVIETATDLEETRRQTEEVWDFLLSDLDKLQQGAL